MAPNSSAIEGAPPFGVTGELGVDEAKGEELVPLGVDGEDGEDVVWTGGMEKDGSFKSGEHNP